MRTTSFLLTGAALGIACLLVAPRESVGYTTIGGSLNLGQRDVRVYNNWTKASANNNTTPDANWPGYDGCEMSIWKGCSEWASELHGGTGAGDPLQTVGSGGANFDISWQGNATAIGNANANVHSQISGSSGGVLAYTETPIADGWRIRYYENWSWQDGPGSQSGIDIQGVACHEYGHALGLGHTNVNGATMYPSISGNGAAQRSIEADDIAGVKFIYGVKSASKPHIGSVSLSGSQLTIFGSNFDLTGNEVWFTQAAAGGTGTPIKVTGVTSDGTTIVVTIPGTAGPGDVLVKNSGNSNSNLSNAWPIDPVSGPPCGVTTYCTAKVSSGGFPATLSYGGSPSYSSADFQLVGYNGSVGSTLGIYIYSNTGPAATPFSNGFLCLSPPIVRGPAHTYDSFGLVVIPISIDLAQIGTERWYQLWFRDTSQPDGTGVGLSDALDVIFCP